MTPETHTAVVDRIEDGIAVLLIEDDSGTVIEERTPAADELPSEIEAGDVVELTLDGDDIATVTRDSAATESRKQRAQNRFDQLAERPGDEESERSS